MKKLSLIKLGILLAASCIVPAGYVQGVNIGISVSAGPAEIYTTAAPPAPIIEVQPASPGVGYVWTGGSWAWNNNRWGWEKGQWQTPPRAGMHYTPHHYQERGGQHVFQRGGWR
jgi:hypothetical protein